LVRVSVRSWGAADSGGQLSVDQLLQRPLEQAAEQIADTVVAQARHQLGNSGIIVMDHRVAFLL
jgi:hypothetical protein